MYKDKVKQWPVTKPRRVLGGAAAPLPRVRLNVTLPATYLLFCSSVQYSLYEPLFNYFTLIDLLLNKTKQRFVEKFR